MVVMRLLSPEVASRQADAAGKVEKAFKERGNPDEAELTQGRAAGETKWALNERGKPEETEPVKMSEGKAGGPNDIPPCCGAYAVGGRGLRYHSCWNRPLKTTCSQQGTGQHW